MDEEEVGLLNRELLDLLRELAPWAAEQLRRLCGRVRLSQ